MPKLITITTLAVFAVLLVGTSTAQAFDSFTGCLTPGGTIIHMAQGDAPKKPCNRNQTLIQLQQRVNREFDSHYDHDRICEAFHELNLSAQSLDNLGCPSTPTLTKKGTLTRVTRAAMRSNNNYNVCGILAIEENPLFGAGWFWVIKEGWAVDKFPTPIIGGDQECFDKCDNDDKCIAAQWLETKPGTHTVDIGECTVYHHSDHLQFQNSGHCGATQDQGSFANCTELVQTENTFWWVRVPDGQTIDNCPGVAATP